MVCKEFSILAQQSFVGKKSPAQTILDKNAAGLTKREFVDYTTFKQSTREAADWGALRRAGLMFKQQLYRTLT